MVDYKKTPKLKKRFEASTDPAQKERIAQKIIAKGGRPPKGYGGLTSGGQGLSAPNYGKMDLTTAGGILEGSQKAAQFTAQENIRLNRPDEFNPYGELGYTFNPETGSYEARIKLSESEQAKLDAQNARDMQLYETQNQMFGGIRSQIGQPLDFGGLPEVNKDYSKDRQRVEGSIYDRFQRRMGDRFAQEKEDTRQMLADRGIPMGSERYNREMEQLSQRQNDASLDAQSQAVQMGGQEQQNLFNMGLSGRQQGINETLTQRSIPLSEYGQLQSYQTGVTNPNFNPMYQATMQAPDVAGAANIQQSGQLQREQIAAQRAAAGASAHSAAAVAGANNAGAMARLQADQAFQREQAAAIMNQPQPKQPNPWMAAGAGFASGVGSAIGGGGLL